MKEIWIDGEYFPDLVDMAKREKAQEISKVIISGMCSQVKALSDKNYIGVEVAKDLMKAQVSMIMSTPLFPSQFPSGGITVEVNQ